MKSHPLPASVRDIPDGWPGSRCDLGLREIRVNDADPMKYDGPRCDKRDHKNRLLRPIARCGGCGRWFCQQHILDHPCHD